MSMFLLLRWLWGIAAVFVTIYLIDGVAVMSPYAGFMGATMIALVNTVTPYTIRISGFARTLLTLLLFLLIMNAFMLYVIDSLRLGILVDSFRALVLASVTIATLCWFAAIALEPKMFR